MEQALYQAAILTFEELGFMFPVENKELTEISDSAGVRVAVAFSGVFSGRLIVQVENKVLPIIASNMLGEPEPFEDELMYDVLGEFANVICGNALPAIAGKQEIFRLEAPQLVDQQNITEKPAAAAHLELETGRANVVLYLN
jgi:CheY-specific phosphatase CheX